MCVFHILSDNEYYLDIHEMPLLFCLFLYRHAGCCQSIKRHCVPRSDQAFEQTGSQPIVERLVSTGDCSCR